MRVQSTSSIGSMPINLVRVMRPNVTTPFGSLRGWYQAGPTSFARRIAAGPAFHTVRRYETGFPPSEFQIVRIAQTHRAKHLSPLGQVRVMIF
ncbi:MAG: hypothetical protein AB7F66_00665 [Bacteriovoracia bacterium]